MRTLWRFLRQAMPGGGRSRSIANDEDHLARLRQGVAVWNEWRAQNPKHPVDLRGANLCDANLSGSVPEKRFLTDLIITGVNLSHADLSHADLRQADLSHADLIYANLEGACLSGAVLCGADLRQADLAGTDLRGANLVGTELSLADLAGTDLGGASLQLATLIRANLEGANLGGANFFRAIFSNGSSTFTHRTNLSRANLEGASLSQADLSYADLSRANLEGASLSQADLIRANLEGANLAGTNLGYANLSWANLRGADLSGARLSETVFADTDLSATKGLETCQHQAPSIIDHRTLQRSGRLPLAFLRGCGLPDRLIDYLPSLLEEAIQYYSCFISYSSKDDAFAKRLHAALGYTLAELPLFFRDTTFRSYICDNIKYNTQVRDYWLKTFAAKEKT